MRIAVVGAGVVGGYFGGRLAHAGGDVVFMARGRRLQELREHGLQLDGVDGNFTVHPIDATDDPKSVGIRGATVEYPELGTAFATRTHAR